MAIPRLTRRWGNPTVLVSGLVISVIGMAWLSRLGPDTAYLTGIALPMILIGIGQGGALGPLTAGGLADVTPEDAGAAGGVTNVAHQIGGSFGLAVLVGVFAAADAGGALQGDALLAHRIAASLTAGAVLLALALLIALAVRPHRRVPAQPPVSARATATGCAPARAWGRVRGGAPSRRYGAVLMPPVCGVGVDAPVLRMARAGYRIEG